MVAKHFEHYFSNYLESIAAASLLFSIWLVLRFEDRLIQLEALPRVEELGHHVYCTCVQRKHIIFMYSGRNAPVRWIASYSKNKCKTNYAFIQSNSSLAFSMIALSLTHTHTHSLIHILDVVSSFCRVHSWSLCCVSHEFFTHEQIPDQSRCGPERRTKAETHKKSCRMRRTAKRERWGGLGRGGAGVEQAAIFVNGGVITLT